MLGVGATVVGVSGGTVAAATAKPGVGLEAEVGSGVGLAANVGRGAIVKAGMVFSGGVSVGNAVGLTTTAEVGVVTGGGSVGAGWAEQPAQTSSDVRISANAGRKGFLTAEIPIGLHQISPLRRCIEP
ncbi:MAG: hypothetical protein IH991_18510 [Planctomycetes bacterium]|nr:hypothetical protein [Planctomycetota bacterium]